METVEVPVPAREFKGTNERLLSRVKSCEDMVRLKEGQPISLSPMRPVNRPLITRIKKQSSLRHI